MHRLPLSRRAPQAVLLALVGLLALPACSDDDDDNTPDAGQNKPDSGTPDSGTPDSGTPDSGTPDSGTPDSGTEDFTCEGKTQATLNFAPGQEDDLQDAVNSMADCTTINLAAGSYTFTNAITIRKNGITLKGAGKGAQGEGTGGAASTVLNFSSAVSNSNGVDVVGKLFTITDLALWNAKKDALRVENSTNVTIQRIRTEWAQENQESNGKYGIYPVKSKYVTIEDCEAYNAADAGIYVGQTEYAYLRNNIAKKNVAGIEIENTRYATVTGNTAIDNTAGLVVFDLPGNPISGTDVFVENNTITGNNRPNFASVTASSSTVSQVPAGTGSFILASRRVEFTGNTWGDNNTVDIAVLSGLAIESDPTAWSAGGFNFGTSDVYVHGNTFTGGSGDSVDNGQTDQTKRPLGALVSAVYQYGQTQGVTHLEHLLWDGIDPAPRSETRPPNAINICVGGNTLPAAETGAMMVDFDLATVSTLLQASTPNVPGAWNSTTRYAQGAAPFNCSGFTPAVVKWTPTAP